MPNWLSAIRQRITRPVSANRRREPRHAVKLHIEVRTTEGVIYGGVSRDLSPRGMGALVTATLKDGEQVHIKYEHPGRPGEQGRTVIRRATVSQRFGFRYGFEFDLPIDI